MNDINPQAILIVAIGAVAGALAHHTLIGLAVGLGAVAFASFINP